MTDQERIAQLEAGNAAKPRQIARLQEQAETGVHPVPTGPKRTRLVSLRLKPRVGRARVDKR